jgi:hypothetical protein
MREEAMDVAAVERAEAELDVFVTRRHDKRVADEGERAAEEAWAASCRRHEEQQRERNRAAWAQHYDKMRGLHWGLGDEYDRRLKALEESA